MHLKRLAHRALVVSFVVAVTAAPRAQSLPVAWQHVAHDVLREIVDINTAEGGAGTTAEAQAIMARLAAAGFSESDMQLVGPDAKNRNLIIRYRGAGAGKPILMIAHMDTVTARAADWSTDPFTFTEKDGWWYGRGINDDKAGVATLVANLLRWKAEAFRPTRDLIIALTSFEETDARPAGFGWVVSQRRDLIDADYCLNTDAGGGELHDGTPVLMTVQAAEKVYQSFHLEVTDPGGHSSLPRKQNAIYTLAAALGRLAAYQFPVQLTDVSREYFKRTSTIQRGQLAADMRAIASNPSDGAAAARLSESPLYNATLRTTCVATRLDAGHADNALPQRAVATVNCRILPGVDPASVQATLQQIVNDASVRITPVETATPSPASPLRPDVVDVIDRLVRDQFKVPLVPEMSTGATDGLFARNAGIPTYGISALFDDPDDVRAHGRDERVSPRWFYEAVEFWNRMVHALAGSERS